MNRRPKGQCGNAHAAGPAGRVERSTVEIVTRNPENLVASPRAREQARPLTDPQNHSRFVTCTRASTQLAHPAGEGTLNSASPRGGPLNPLCIDFRSGPRAGEGVSKDRRVPAGEPGHYS